MNKIFNSKTALACIAALFATLSPLAAESEFVSLFDGKTLDGWDGDPKHWRIENGEIVGETTPEKPLESNTFLIWEGGEVADFELKVDFKLRNRNSGIQYRSFRVDANPWALGGYQADIADNKKWMGAAYGERYKGPLAMRGEKTVVGEEDKSSVVVGHVGDPDELFERIDIKGWNTYHIIARGNQCIQKINGVTVSEFSENASSRLEKGLIGLQLHVGAPMEVRFRNIYLKKIK